MGIRVLFYSVFQEKMGIKHQPRLRKCNVLMKMCKMKTSETFFQTFFLFHVTKPANSIIQS